MRPYLNSLATGLNLVLIARAPLAAATLQESRGALASLLRRAKILPSDES